MANEFWFSVVLGVGIGGLYVIIAYVSFRLSLSQSSSRFMTLALGGIAIRLFLAILAIALVLALAPVRQNVFVLTFFVVFVVGLGLEVGMLHHRQKSATKRRNHDATTQRP